MPHLKVGEENSGDIQIHYEDYGAGKPVVLIHGFPLSGVAWEKQVPALLKAGHRVITYDRRGFGTSSQPAVGYDYDTFVSDLNMLMTTLDLRDATLVGHSMGTGEVARYLGKYGSDRIDGAVFISPLLPFILRTPDNIAGIDSGALGKFQRSILEDRFAYLTKFFSDFFSFDTFKDNGVSEQAFQYCWSVGAWASAKATHDCVAAWATDFRSDVLRIDVPSLIIHGTADRVLPFELTAKRLHESIKGSKLVPVENGPHSLPWTHADVVNGELLSFLGSESKKRSVA